MHFCYYKSESETAESWVQLGNAKQFFKVIVLIYIHSSIRISLLHFKTYLNIFCQFQELIIVL